MFAFFQRPGAYILPAVAIVLSLGLADLARSPAAHAAPAKTVSVQIKNFAFVPAVLTISPGTTVTWTNVDEDPHSVVSTTKTFRSAALDTNGKFSFTFTKAGDFAYFCSLHPHMTAKITVKPS
ncbi:hypothetical protein BH09PSE3_BH09PSE3_05220 [soil metagenome]